jgi:hypothetical protein
MLQRTDVGSDQRFIPSFHVTLNAVPLFYYVRIMPARYMLHLARTIEPLFGTFMMTINMRDIVVRSKGETSARAPARHHSTLFPGADPGR